MERTHLGRLLIGAFFALVSVPHSRTFGANAYFDIYASGSGSTTLYDVGFDVLSSPGLTFTTLDFSSADGTYNMALVNGNGPVHQPPYMPLADFVQWMQQPFIMTFDKGLPTYHQYTMSADLGTFASSGISPPTIQYPTAGAFVDPTQSTFLFHAPVEDGPLSIELVHFESTGATVPDGAVTVPAGTSQWTSPAPLAINTANYLFEVSAQRKTTDFGLTTPVDSSGAPLPGWSSLSFEFMDATHFFSTAPEPSSLGIFAVAALFLTKRVRATRER
jgi:hypothetical protein